MTSSRVTVSLERPERAALMQLAQAELRSEGEQARHILRQELRRQGFLQSSSSSTDQPDRAESEDAPLPGLGIVVLGKGWRILVILPWITSHTDEEESVVDD